MRRTVAALFVAVLLFGFGVVAKAEDDPANARGFVPDKVYQFGNLDSVNLFNGNLVISIPIGQSYPVGPQLNYGLTLSYNSKVWDTVLVEYPYPETCGQEAYRSEPHVMSNAGMGWTIGFGRLFPPCNVANTTGRAYWIYESPDGAVHQFDSTNPTISPFLSGTSDNSHLRMKRNVAPNGHGTATVEFPDGTIQTYSGTNCNEWQLQTIQDRAGNSVAVTWSASGSVQTLTDPFGRTTIISYNQWGPYYYGWKVSTVQVPSFSATDPNAHATWEFTYRVGRLPRPLIGSICDPTDAIEVPLLTKVLLPDGSFYAISQPHITDLVHPDRSFDRDSIDSITLPTGGTIEYTYTQYLVPGPTCLPFDGSIIGVKTRTFAHPDGRRETWTYDTAITDGLYVGTDLTQFCPWDVYQTPLPQLPVEQRTTTITAPNNEKETHYFSVWQGWANYDPRSHTAQPSTNGFDAKEFGLALTHLAPSVGGKWLSTEYFDSGIAAACQGMPARSGYVEYDFHGAEVPSLFDTVSKGSRTVFNCDRVNGIARYVDTASDDYDGYGHYRTQTESGNFGPNGTVVSRTVRTNYNGSDPEVGDPATNFLLKRATGTFPGDFHPIGPGDSWILNTLTSVVTQEAGQTSKQFFFFNQNTGLLMRKRVQKGTSASPDGLFSDAGPTINDLIVENEFGLIGSSSAGQLLHENYYGGDKAPLQDAGGTLANLDLSALPHRTVDHTWSFGALQSTRLAGAPWATTNLTINSNTGFPVTSTDPAGRVTRFTYDAMARITSVTLPNQTGTEYQYHRADGGPASVDAITSDPGGAELTHQRFQYDAFGRLAREQSLMPDGTYNLRETVWDSLNRKTSVSEVVREDSSSRPKTTFTYDAFGRPVTITPPDLDSHKVTMTYAGVRRTERHTSVGGSLGADGSVTESPVTTVEEYDPFGRLITVEEGPETAKTTTTYAYDLAGNLSDVTMQPPSGEPQHRKFRHDNRGFLRFESHPEMKPVVYSDYDVFGNVGRKVTGTSGAFDLTFSYDDLNRLRSVQEAGDTAHPLKQFTFDSLAAGDPEGPYAVPGALLRTERRNTIPEIGDRTVSTWLRYDDTGRVSDKKTAIENGPSFSNHFTYDALSNIASLTYPVCSGCAVAATGAQLPPARTIEYARTRSLLTGVQRSATQTLPASPLATLSYWPNGMVHTVAHANGVTDTIAIDETTSMARPLSISFTGIEECAAPAVNVTGPATIVASAAGSASVTAVPGATYAWTISGGALTSAATAPSVTFTAGCSGSAGLSVVVRAACSTSTTGTLQIPITAATAVVSGGGMIDSHGNATVQAVLTGTAPFRLVWSDGVIQNGQSGTVTRTVTPASSTVYTLTATDAHNCAVTVTGYAAVDTTVCSAPRIVGNIGSGREVGDLATISLSVVVAADTNVFYQWRRKVGSGAFENIQNATEATYTTQLHAVDGSASTTYQFQVVVTSCGIAVPSEVATFAVTPCLPPVFDSLPIGYTSVYAGDFVHLNAHAAGAGVQYQWYHGITNPQPIGSPSSSGLLDTWQQNADYDVFFVRAFTTCGDHIASIESPRICVRTIGTCDFPPVVVEASDVKVVVGTTAILSVNSVWNVLTYQWYSGMSGDTRDPLASVAGHPNQLQAGAVAKTYWVRATGECGTYVDSDTITVRLTSPELPGQVICSPVVFMQQPASQNVASGQNVTMTVAVKVPSEVTDYQWFRGTNAANGTSIGAGSQVTVAPAMTTSYFARVATACSVADTVPVMLHVTSCSGLTIASQPVDRAIVSGSSTSLSITASAVGGEALSYQWYAGDSGDDTHPIAGGNTSTFITGSLTAAVSYWVRVTSSSCVVDSSTAHVCIAPAITHQPAGSDVPWMQRVLLYVTASGTGPLSYQWYHGDKGDTTLPAGTLSELAINPAGVQRLWVRVTGCGGSVDSDAVTVTGCNPVIISTQPQSPTIHSGESTTLSVSASQPFQSPPMIYQWYRGSVGDKSQPVGSNASTFTTPVLTTATNYWVSLTAGACETDSNQVTVFMCAIPSLAATGPTSVHKGEMVNVVLSPNPGTTGITYQWYEGPSGDTSSPRTNATAYAVTVQPQAATSYWCRVTNATCSVNSSAVTVNVCIPTITTQPVSGGPINSGQSFALTVVSDLPAISTYQWYRGNQGDVSNPIAGAILSSYNAVPTTTTTYWVRVTGSCGTAVASNAATVSVCVPPAITTHPAGSSITRGQSVSLTAVATGTGVTYQWYQGAGTASPYGGATSATLTMTPQVSDSYWCRVSNSCGTADSSAAQVDVCSAPVISAQPQSLTINSGQTATLSVSVQANALNPAAHYHWYRGSVGDKTTLVGTDASTFTTPALTTAASYWVAVNAGNCETASQQATISICALPSVVATGPTSIHKGDTITLALSPNPGTGGITYQWYTGASGDTSNAVTSATAYAVTVQPQVTTTYWCRVTNATCSVNSAAITANVCIPRITTQPISHMINSGQSWTMTAGADISTTWQWYRGSSGDVSNPISGATVSSYTAAPTAATSYWARATGSCGTAADSTAATVSICAVPAITTNPTGASITRGQSVNLTVAASGTGLSYQWYQGAGTGSPYAGATAATLTASPQVPTSYWCRVTGSCGTADSAAAQVDVCMTPVISVQPRSATISDGATTTLSVTASQPTGLALHYQWYRSTTGVPSNPVGTDSPSYTTPAINAQTNYYVRISSGACFIDSATATITTCPLPVMQTVGGGNFPRYQSILLRVTPAPDDSTFAFYEGPVGDTSNFVGGGGIQSTLYVSASHNTQYWARVDNGTCHVDTSATVVTVY